MVAAPRPRRPKPRTEWRSNAAQPGTAEVQDGDLRASAVRRADEVQVPHPGPLVDQGSGRARARETPFKKGIRETEEKGI